MFKELTFYNPCFFTSSTAFEMYFLSSTLIRQDIALDPLSSTCVAHLGWKTHILVSRTLYALTLKKQKSLWNCVRKDTFPIDLN